MKKLFSALHLFWQFILALAASAKATTDIIMRASSGVDNLPPTQIIKMPFAPMSAMGASIMGCMITLTPGTTTIDIDMEQHQFLIHVLDATDIEAVVQDIRNSFEPDLLVLFGEGAA